MELRTVFVSRYELRDVEMSDEGLKYTYVVDHAAPKQSEPKSVHKAGEPFDDKWEYAGELRVPNGTTDRFVGLLDSTAEIKREYAPTRGIARAAINNGLREILRPHTPAEKYNVGDVVKLKGWIGLLPDGKYKVLATDVIPKAGDIIIDGDGETFQTIHDYERDKLTVVAPMSLDWYNFEIAGVTCRAYDGHGNGMSYRMVTFNDSKEVYKWEPKGNTPIDRIFNAVDDRLKSERGYGIIPVPFEVSQGNFEAPEGEGKCELKK